MRRLIPLAALAALALAAGCKHPTDAPPPRPGTIDERQACTADGDCAAVELACCDHCNGGTVVGVHKDFAADVHASYAGDCHDTMCTQMACVEQPTPVCQQGMCALALGGTVTATPLPTR